MRRGRWRDGGESRGVEERVGGGEERIRGLGRELDVLEEREGGVR